ncbi:UNVERIFIED_ORG: hypothetical protein J2W82_002308 [Pseudomonas mohnii]|jgi:hypothetical protein|nr:hypothetical protein [Pseudomonas mohnii]
MRPGGRQGRGWLEYETLFTEPLGEAVENNNKTVRLCGHDYSIDGAQ